MRMWEHFGDGAEATLTVTSGVAGSYVRMEHVGEPYNPVGTQDEEQLSSSVFTSLGMRGHYAYLGDRNILRLPLPRSGMNPVLGLLIGIAAGAAVGMLGGLLLPERARDLITDVVVDPLFDMWIRMLNALAAPVIFFMVVTTMLSMRKVEDRGGSRGFVIVRYCLMSFVVGTLAVATATLAFRIPIVADVLNAARVQGIIDGATRIVPENILDPFITSNTPQLLLVAFVMGNAIIALGDRAAHVNRLIRQTNMVTSLVTSWMSNLVPFFSGVLLALEIWDNRVAVLLQMWKPLVLGLVVSLAFFLVELCWVRLAYKVRPGSLLSKIKAPFFIALRAGTLDASYGAAEHSCVRELGIDATFTDVTLPQGLVLYMPASIMGTLIYTVFTAREFGVQITPLWCLMAIVLDVLLFVATPPVPGANLLAFIALFQQLLIPKEALLDAMIFDILFGLFANGANQALLQMEMMRQADRLGLLNRKLLRGVSARYAKSSGDRPSTN